MITVLVIAACFAPHGPTPYVASACPLPLGAHGYPVVAHDPAGKLDTASLSRIARAVGSNFETSTVEEDDDTLPDDLATLSASLQRNRPLARHGWRPSSTDTGSMAVVYRPTLARPLFRAAPGDFGRRLLRAATNAREAAESGRPQLDTLPLQLDLAGTDSVVVQVHFGSEPGPTDGAAYFAAQERDVRAIGPTLGLKYPPSLREIGMTGKVVVGFVVGPDSTADTSTMHVLRSTHPRFTDAVLDFVVRSRYVPQELDCHIVATVVQQPFVFALRERKK